MSSQLNEKYVKMTTEPVRRLVCRLAVPTVISMLVTALYNIADTFFVGRIGTQATAGVGLVFPIMTIIQESFGISAKLGLMAVLLVINMIRTMILPAAYDIAFDSIDDLSGFTSPYIVTPLISSVVGILFWLTLVGLIGKALYESRFVNYLSCNTFWIMGLHIVFFNILNCILMLVNSIVELPYFDVETFRESEWYYWEISPNFKLAYVLVGILGPINLH